MNRHKGTKIGVYLNAQDLEKLDQLIPLSRRKTRADTIRTLIRGQPLVDQSFRECLSQLGRIGGLIKMKGVLPPAELKRIQDAVYEMRGYLYGEDHHQGK